MDWASTSAFVWGMWDKSKNQFCYRLSNKRRPKVGFSEISKKRAIQKITQSIPSFFRRHQKSIVPFFGRGKLTTLRTTFTSDA